MKSKKIVMSSIIATALLGAGVFANSVSDATNIREYGSSKNKVTNERVAPKIDGEENGIYKTWIPYYYHESFYKRTNSTMLYDASIPIYTNYLLKTEDGVKKYYVGFVFPEAKVDGYEKSSTVEKDTYFKDKVENFKASPLAANIWMLDLDKMPDEGWNKAGSSSSSNWNDPYSTVAVKQRDKTKIKFVDNAADWPFSLNAMDIFGDTTGQTVEGVTITKPTALESWQHLLVEIPVTDEKYDHLFGKVGEVQSGNNFLYQWDTTTDMFDADAMSVESNFAIQKFTFRTGTSGDGKLEFGIDLGFDSQASSYPEQFWSNASDRENSIWLRYPEPTLKVTNATEDADGNLIIGDGSFGSGYNINIEYNHTVTDEKFSIVHGMDYKLYGPAVKGDGTTETLWDHIWVDDSGIYRQFRTNPNDPNEMSKEFYLENNATNAAVNSWLDGTNDIGVTVAGDINPDTDEKDGLGDINIAMTDPVTFTPADPDFTTGQNSSANYTTKYLFSDTEYRSEINIDGKSTVLGQTGNSFFWPDDSMSLSVEVTIDVYEPSTPVITKFELIDNPLHDDSGEIKNSWSYSMDAKTDNEFDGTSYFPSGVEYVQLVGDDGTVYSEMIPTTPYEETGDGVFEGTFESGNLPANQTDLALKLKVYYGQDIGYTTEDTENGKFWSTTSTTPILVNTGVRGSVDYETSLSISDNTDTSATLTIATNPVQTLGSEASTDKWGEGLSAYETSEVTNAVVSITSAKPNDITNDDLNEWDQDTAFTNNDSWVLTSEQLSSLNTDGTVDVVLDGLLPNETYTFKVNLTYNGETKPSYADERWDSSWEDSRVSTSNSVTLETNDWKVYEPDNIDLSYEFVVADAETRTGNFKYEITMDVSGNTNETDIYYPTNVSAVTFTSNEVADVVVTQASAEANAWETWEYNESEETLTVKYDSSLDPSVKGFAQIDSTLSAKITSDAGDTITYPDGSNIEENITFPDRGNLEVKASSPTEVESTTSSITFGGTIDEVIPAGAVDTAWNADQYAKNTIEKVDIVTDTGETIATTSDFTRTESKVAGDSVVQYSYEIEAKDLNPNKKYDVQAVVSYSGNSKINDEGYFKGKYPNVNEAKTFESSFESTDGTTDAEPAKAPVLSINGSDVNVVLDESTRKISASGQFKLGVVSEQTSSTFASDYEATEVTAIRIKNGDETLFTLNDSSIIDSANSDEIVVDWTIDGDKIEAKTSYDLQIEVDYAGGTKQYESPAQHIQFDSGSRGDLTYTGVNYKEISNEAGPLLTMSYGLDYTGNEGYDYSDFNLLEIKKVEVKGQYTTDALLAEGQDISELASDQWTDLDETLLEIDPYTYDGNEHEVKLGYDQLIDGLPRYPGAPTGDAVDIDENNNGTYDKSYLYKFFVSVEADYPDGKTVLTSDSIYYNQFAFLKGGFTPIIREFELDEPVIDGYETEAGPEASVKGSFWIEQRSEGFYDGMSGDAYATYNEMEMWESGVKNITLYNVTDPDRVDFTTADPLDIPIWSIEDGTPTYFDEPDSFNDTPYIDLSGEGEVEVRDKYDAWLNGEHEKAEFTIEGLVPGETYKFQLVVHYSGDNIAGTHTDGTDGAVVDPAGYDKVLDMEIAIPLAGVEPVQEEDLQFNTVKSSLTSWTLSYSVFNAEVDPRYENYVFNDIKIIDTDNGDVIAESNEAAGELVATNLALGTDPVNSNWEIVISTEDEQELEIELNEEWLAKATDMEGNALFTENEDGSRDWKDSEADAVETWDIDTTEGFFTLPTEPISNIGENSFELTITTTDLFNQMVNHNYVDVNTISIIDAATNEVLEAEIIDGASRASASNEINILVSGLNPDTEYGSEGLEVVFDIIDKYSPSGEETPVPVSFGNTGALEIRTLALPEPVLGAAGIIGIIIAILIPIILLVLFLLWWFMLAWRKEKETDFKPGEVTFQLNKSYASDAKKLDGAKLKSSIGELNYSISKATNGKILVTVTGITKKEPIKGLKFALDNRSVKAENAKIEESNKALTTKFEADLKAWEDKKAKTPEGVTFSDPKPAKPTLAKKGKVAKDITIIGAVKTVKPAPKEAKPKANAPKTGSGTARKIS